MPRPSESVIEGWASDGTHTDPGQPWDAQSNTVPILPAQVASGWAPNQVLPAEQFNLILANLAAWVDHVGEISDVVRPEVTRGIYVGASDARPTGSSPDWSFPTASPGVAEGAGSADGLVFDLRAGSRLPFASTVDSVRVVIKPGTARSGGSRMAVRLERVNADFTRTQIGSDIEDNGTTNPQEIVFSGVDLYLAAVNLGSIIGTPAMGLLVTVFGGVGGSPDECHMVNANVTLAIL